MSRERKRSVINVIPRLFLTLLTYMSLPFFARPWHPRRMNLILRIPDELATRLGAPSADLERQALKAIVVDGFRAGRLNKDELPRAR